MILKYIPLEEGMMIMDEAIMKARRIIEGYPETKFTGEEYQKFYQCVYFMATYHSTAEKTMELYRKFGKSLEESIFSIVLPSLMNKQGTALLSEIVIMWSNYKLMAKWLCRFFEYLDRYFIPQHRALESLNDMSISCFRDLVLKKLYYRFLDVAVTLIKQEREGLQIDGVLLKNFFDALLEISYNGQVKYYEDFERVLLVDSSGYYSQLASEWLLCDSSAEYVQKVFWCLDQEKKRASQYLRPESEAKLLQIVRYQLLEKNANKLMEKKQAENSGVVTDYQEMLSKCAGMKLEEGSSSSLPEEWLSNLMASSIRI